MIKQIQRQNLYNKIESKYMIYQKETEYDFPKAVSQLKLKLRKDDPGDQQQVKFLLMETLGYPSLQRAYEHHDSNRLGTNDLLTKQTQIQNKIRQKDIQDLQMCSCCGLLLNNQKLPFGTHFEQLNLGIGVSLFFKDYLYNAIIFSFLFVAYSLYAISTNAVAFNMNQQTKIHLCGIGGTNCGFSDIGAGSKVLIQNQRKNTLSQIQSYIGISLIVLWGLANIVKTHIQQKLIAEVETKRVSASDFTLMIKHFPKQRLGSTKQQNLQKIQKIFNDYFQQQKQKRQCNYPYEVISVNVARPLYSQNRRTMVRIQKIKQDLYNRQQVFRGWIRYRKLHDKFPVDFDDRSKYYESYNNFYSDIFQKQISSVVPYADQSTVFVTLRHSKARQEIQKNNAPESSILKYFKVVQQSDFPIPDIKIRKAPQPQQIKWNNIGFPSNQRTMRRLAVWLTTVALIGISLGINIGLSVAQQKIWLSILKSIVITLINTGIQLAIIYLTSFQYQYISSYQQFSIALKIAVGQIVNSILVPIVVIKVVNDFPTNTQNINRKSWLKASGLVDDVFFIALFNLVVPVLTLIDFYEIVLKLIRWWYSDPDRRLLMFGQKQLNKYFGNYIFDMGYQYAFLMKTSVFTAFFVCMQPIIALFAPFALMFYYFSVKRNLFYHFQRPGYHFPTTNIAVDVILLFSPIAFGLGCLFVNNVNGQTWDELNKFQSGNGTFGVNLATTIVGAVFFIIVPFRLFYKCVPRPNIENKDYVNKKMLIYTDYDRANPVTKQTAITQFQAYIRQLERNTGLTDQAQMVKLYVSTIQKIQTLQADCKQAFRQSVSRVSMIRFSSIQPKLHDSHFFEQLAHEPSVNFYRRSMIRSKDKIQSPRQHEPESHLPVQSPQKSQKQKQNAQQSNQRINQTTNKFKQLLPLESIAQNRYQNSQQVKSSQQSFKKKRSQQQ